MGVPLLMEPNFGDYSCQVILSNLCWKSTLYLSLLSSFKTAVQIWSSSPTRWYHREGAMLGSMSKRFPKTLISQQCRCNYVPKDMNTFFWGLGFSPLCSLSKASCTFLKKEIDSENSSLTHEISNTTYPFAITLYGVLIFCTWIHWYLISWV